MELFNHIFYSTYVVLYTLYYSQTHNRIEILLSPFPTFYMGSILNRCDDTILISYYNSDR